MKKKLIGTLTAIALIFGTAALTGCGGGHSHEHHGEGTHEHAEHVQYACPMDCEEGKTYEEAGSCPVCKMDLVKVEGDSKADTEAAHEHAH